MISEDLDPARFPPLQVLSNAGSLSRVQLPGFPCKAFALGCCFGKLSSGFLKNRQKKGNINFFKAHCGISWDRASCAGT